MSKKTEAVRSLIFDWPQRFGGNGKLILAMLLVLVGMTAFFYVFQVVYPQNQRFSPVPHQVYILNPSDPQTDALLQKVQDRDFLLLPSTQPLASEASLNDSAPVFHPSFTDHTLTLQDLPHRTFTAPPARLLDRDAAVMPALDLSDLKPAKDRKSTMEEESSFVIAMKISGLAEARLPKLLPAFPDLEMNAPEATEYEIAVDEQGRVVFALSLTTTESPEVLRQLGLKIRRLRFQPDIKATEEGAGKANTAPGKPTFARINFEWRREL